MRNYDIAVILFKILQNIFFFLEKRFIIHSDLVSRINNLQNILKSITNQ